MFASRGGRAGVGRWGGGKAIQACIDTLGKKDEDTKGHTIGTIWILTP